MIYSLIQNIFTNYDFYQKPRLHPMLIPMEKQLQPRLEQAIREQKRADNRHWQEEDEKRTKWQSKY